MSAQPQAHLHSRAPVPNPDQLRADYMREIAQIRAGVSQTLAQVDKDSKRMATPFWKIMPILGGAATAAAAAALMHFLV